MKFDQRDLDVRHEPGHVVLVRWHDDEQGRRVTEDLARLSLKELGVLVCEASEGWDRIGWHSQLARAAAVANIIGGACPPLLESDLPPATPPEDH